MSDPGVHPALEYVLAALQDVLDENELAPFRPAVDALAAQYDPADLAAAALKLAYEVAPARPPRVVPGPGTVRLLRQAEAAGPSGAGLHRSGDAAHEHREHADRPRRDRRDRPSEPGVTQLYVNVGRMDRVRPGDLVGAITGETDLRGADIGAIDIFEKFSLVEVPEAAVDDVIERMRGVTIRGRDAQVRRDRGPSR